MERLARREFDCTAGTEILSSVLARSIAEAKGVEPQELETPIYQYVDPGALDGIFDSSLPGISREGEISFPTEEFRVTIEMNADSSGVVRVAPKSELDGPAPDVSVEADDRAPSP